MKNIPREYSHPVRIGSGSFSTVFRVREQKFDRNVVLKNLKFTGEKERLRIEQEIQVLSSMQLPCMPHIYDVIRKRNRIVIVMEWIRGVPLSLLSEKILTGENQLLIASAIISTLALLHKSNVAHGDLKPENILITSDLRVFLVDFGFSRVSSLQSKSTGVIRGTPAYMAPELWSGRETIDFKKVDLYALGVLLSRLMGAAIPAFVSELTESDPDLRPVDAAAFEKTWRSEIQSGSSDHHRFSTVVKTAVEEYTAQLLLTAARELYSNGKRDDAYALLSESLDIWPDNGDALDFLQKKFSAPLKREQKHLLLAFLSIAAVILALTGAFYIGRQSLNSDDILGDLLLQQEEKRLIVSVNSLNVHSTVKKPPVALRQVAVNMNLTGTVTLSKISNRGFFIIDSRPIESNPDGLMLQLTAGTHRIEWFDSISQRRYGEIVDVLPFEKKNVSLQRFTHGN
ncbi:MAG: serine/threonine-protein kinase [Fibrobacterota bacterium]|nr:serine/threonine-protein kinase [Chitinispirillaceae bacterium]